MVTVAGRMSHRIAPESRIDIRIQAKCKWICVLLYMVERDAAHGRRMCTVLLFQTCVDWLNSQQRVCIVWHVHTSIRAQSASLRGPAIFRSVVVEMYIVL